MKIIALPYIIVFLFLFSNCSGKAETSLETRTVAGNLIVPWEILWGPDNFIWTTERNGRISRVNPETGEQHILTTITEVITGSERGLMGMALHPNFTENPYVYVVYNYQSGSDTKVKLVRFEYDGQKLNSPFTLLENIQGAGIHDGSRLWIDENLKIFMTTGDAGNQSLPQNLSSLNGKTLRMNIDGSVPEDNPIPGSLVWSWGHRNAQGLVMANGILYSSEHGPGSDDEVNIVLKGRNYGWPTVKGYCDLKEEEKFCEDSNVVEPIISLTPATTLAVCGLDYYSGDLIPEWKNCLLLVNLKASKLVRIKLDPAGEKVLSTMDYFTGTFGRLRDICISPDGRVFVATSNRDGRGNPKSNDDRIIEIRPSTSGAGFDKKQGGLIISPNPSNGKIGITYFGDDMKQGQIHIFDALGRKMKTMNFAGNGSVEWSGETDSGERIAPGLYRVVYTDGNTRKEITLINSK